MPETYSKTYDYFDLRVHASDDGDVVVEFVQIGDEAVKSMKIDWNEFEDLIEFVYIHGKGLDNPIVVSYADTREAIEA